MLALSQAVPHGDGEIKSRCRLLSLLTIPRVSRRPAQSRGPGGLKYPTRPIRVIVPQAPGGRTTSWRAISARSGERLGKQVVVDNRPGAEGTIGTETVARANPTATRCDARRVHDDPRS